MAHQEVDNIEMMASTWASTADLGVPRRDYQFI